MGKRMFVRVEDLGGGVLRGLIGRHPVLDSEVHVPTSTAVESRFELLFPISEEDGLSHG